MPTRYETRTGPFAVFTNDADRRRRPGRSGASGRSNATSAAALGLRVPADGPPVEVYVLRDREAFTHFLTFYYPELPPRRAFFLAQGPRRVVYTFHNDRLDEDLRHEATHALLHVAVGDLPLWLDEGLAEYFEGPGRPPGRQPRAPRPPPRRPQDRLAARPRPAGSAQERPRDDPARLPRVVGLGPLPPERPRPRQGGAARPAGRPVGTRPPARPFSARLDGGATGVDHMLGHFERVRTEPVVSNVSRLNPTVLLQDSPLPAPRRSLFGRFLALIGLAGK